MITVILVHSKREKRYGRSHFMLSYLYYLDFILFWISYCDYFFLIFWRFYYDYFTLKCILQILWLFYIKICPLDMSLHFKSHFMINYLIRFNKIKIYLIILLLFGLEVFNTWLLLIKIYMLNKIKNLILTWYFTDFFLMDYNLQSSSITIIFL